MSQVLVPMIFTSVPALMPGADRAHVGVEGPHGHGHARRQTDLGRDFRRERAGLLVGGQGAGGVAIAEHGQVGIETGEELGAGQSAQAS